MNLRLSGIRLLLATGLLFVTALPARAQIYTWHDADGRLVLSNKRPAVEGPVTSYAVPGAAAVRATRDVPMDRSRAYDDLIVEHSKRNGVRQSLVRAVIQVESGFNPYARSEKGAMGLMQLMPATAREFGVRNAYDPSENVRGGVAYLRQLLDRYDNNEELALAAYNAGPGAVDKHGQTIPPYRETKDYVVRVNGLAGKGTAATRTEHAANTELYRSIEIIDGRPVVKYTDKKPQ